MEKDINHLGRLNRVMMSRIKGINNITVLMEAITSKQEKGIDETGQITIKTRNGDVIIDITDIHFYGEINLKNEDDLDVIRRHNLVDCMDEGGTWLPDTFDYETGKAKTTNMIPKGYPSINPIDVFKYNHCCLGKPKRIVCYNILSKFL